MSSLEYKDLLPLFDFPRRRILQSMDVYHCPHAVFYNQRDERCITCHQGEECLWMNRNDALISLERKPINELKQQLLIAVDYIDANLTPHHLSRRDCDCDNCNWRNRVQQALNKDINPITP
jgi:hypothetical protein